MLICLLASHTLMAHELRPAYLELREVTPDIYDVLWQVPSIVDSSFALHVLLPDGCRQTLEPAAQAVGRETQERWQVRCEGGFAGKPIEIQGLEATRIDVLARLEPISGESQTARLTPSDPVWAVPASPSQLEVARTYTVLGIEHILLGIDHLLFVLALIMLVKGCKLLAGTITAFTVAHSITLGLATLGYIHVPVPPVEACIALSIVFVAAEIIRGEQGSPGLTERQPWVVAFTFGLLHGLGFASALSEVGLPQQAIPVALLFFNVGVELGQLSFVVVVLASVQLLRRSSMPLPEFAWRLVPYAIGPIAMYWVIERTLGFVS